MYKEKLIELLKTCDEVKRAIEKLRFGCRFIHIDKFDNSEIEYTLTNINEFNDVSKIGNYVLLYGNTFRQVGWLEPILINSKIIGLPLQERFIRMYCENKGLFISFDNKNMYGEFRILLENNENGIYTIDFNNTKDFDNQNDEVYQKIYELLYNLNK